MKDVSMTRMALSSHPFLLGFEALDRLVEQTAKTDSGGYPPYNIEETGSGAYRISLAVAGFAEADLAVTMEDRRLVVRGRQGEVDAGRTFLHRGIAARQFTRTFVLAEGMEVRAARMKNGLLHIDLDHVPPAPEIRTIRISAGPQDVAE